jgi:hypothetical protein
MIQKNFLPIPSFHYHSLIPMNRESYFNFAHFCQASDDYLFKVNDFIPLNPNLDFQNDTFFIRITAPSYSSESGLPWRRKYDPISIRVRIIKERRKMISNFLGQSIFSNTNASSLFRMYST